MRVQIFANDRIGLTLGGGAIDNPGRYMVLLPPPTARLQARARPYFTENPGDPYRAWDASLPLDYMPTQFVTFRLEGNRRVASFPASPEAVGLRRREETMESRITAALLVKL